MPFTRARRSRCRLGGPLPLALVSILLIATGCTGSAGRELHSTCGSPRYALRYESGFRAGAIAIFDGRGGRARPGGDWITGAPSFSPDGRSLAVTWFDSIYEGRKTAIAILETSPQRRRIVPGTDRGEYPAWSPDGSTIAYARNDYGAGTNEIRLMDATTGAHNRRIAGEGDPKTTSILAPAWSPDGHEIAFVVRDFFSGPSSLWIVNRDGSNPHQVATLTRDDGYDFVSWRPDGTALTLSSTGGAALLDLTTATLTTIPHQAGSVTWFDGGKRVLYYRPVKPGRYRLATGALDGIDLRHDHDVAHIPPQGFFPQGYSMAAACRR